MRPAGLTGLGGWGGGSACHSAQPHCSLTSAPPSGRSCTGNRASCTRRRVSGGHGARGLLFLMPAPASATIAPSWRASKTSVEAARVRETRSVCVADACRNPDGPEPELAGAEQIGSSHGCVQLWPLWVPGLGCVQAGVWGWEHPASPQARDSGSRGLQMWGDVSPQALLPGPGFMFAPRARVDLVLRKWLCSGHLGPSSCSG